MRTAASYRERSAIFEPRYTHTLIEIGERDVESRLDELRAFLGEESAVRSA
jgi:hypothetical protein